MIQVIPRASWGVLYSGGSAGSVWGSVLGGNGDVGSTDTFGQDSMRIPVPIAGTFKNLTSYSGEARGSDISLRLYVNSAPTSLLSTLSAGASQSMNPFDRVTVVPGDDVLYKWGGSFVGFPGLHMGAAIEFDGAQSVYGVSPAGGTVFPDTGWIACALGNGAFSGIAAIPADGVAAARGSICSAPGRLTRMILKELGSVATGGSWTGYLRVNRILQDGSGSTVDTRTILPDGGNFVIGTFDLPLEVLDHVECILIRNDTLAVFAVNQVGLGVAFTPQTSGEFIICGGNNNAITNAYDLYTWVESGQLVADEPIAAAPVSLSGFVTSGLYIEFADPGVGAEWIARLRLNGVNTLAVVTLTSGFSSGAITGLFIPVGSGKLLDILIHSVGGATTGQFHWSLAVSSSGIPVGNIGPIAWLNRTRRQP